MIQAKLASPRRRRVLFVALFFALQLGATIALLEVGLRLARPHNRLLASLLHLPGFTTEFDHAGSTPELLAATTVGFSPGREWCGFVTNSHGFRSPEYTYEREPGRFRVVAIGDSFTGGSGCLPWEDLWVHRLPRALERRMKRDVEVINLGVPAVGPRFELRMWELEGWRLRPDLVVLAFYVGNDFTDDQAREQVPIAVDRYAARSYAVRLWRNLRRLGGATGDGQVPVGEGAGDESKGELGHPVEGFKERFDSEKPTFSEERFRRLAWQRMQLLRRGGERFETLFSSTSRVLVRFSDEVKASGAELLVMIIPDELQVSDELYYGVIEEFGGSPDEFRRGLAQRRLTAFLREQQIRHVDLLPVFRRRGRRKVLYKLRDTHWSAEGNALAARELVKALAPRAAGSNGRLRDADVR